VTFIVRLARQPNPPLHCTCYPFLRLQGISKHKQASYDWNELFLTGPKEMAPRANGDEVLINVLHVILFMQITEYSTTYKFERSVAFPPFKILLPALQNVCSLTRRSQKDVKAVLINEQEDGSHDASLISSHFHPTTFQVSGCSLDVCLNYF
jgi:hypothetical protein